MWSLAVITALTTDLYTFGTFWIHLPVDFYIFVLFYVLIYNYVYVSYVL